MSEVNVQVTINGEQYVHPALSFSVNYTVRSINFKCLLCHKDLTIEKRSPESIASGTCCPCSQDAHYFIYWKDMDLRVHRS